MAYTLPREKSHEKEYRSSIGHLPKARKQELMRKYWAEHPSGWSDAVINNVVQPVTIDQPTSPVSPPPTEVPSNMPAPGQPATVQVAANGLYKPEGKLQHIRCDLEGYTDPIEVHVWYRTNNQYGVQNAKTLLETRLLSAPIKVELGMLEKRREELKQRSDAVTAEIEVATDDAEKEKLNEELTGIIGQLDALVPEFVQGSERYMKAVKEETIDYYRKVCTYVRKIKHNLDLPAVDCDKPETLDMLYDNVYDLALWIAGDGYEKAKVEGFGPNFLKS